MTVLHLQHRPVDDDDECCGANVRVCRSVPSSAMITKWHLDSLLLRWSTRSFISVSEVSETTCTMSGLPRDPSECEEFPILLLVILKSSAAKLEEWLAVLTAASEGKCLLLARPPATEREEPLRCLADDCCCVVVFGSCTSSLSLRLLLCLDCELPVVHDYR